VICIEGASADSVWREAVHRLGDSGALQESRDQPTRELLHVVFTITDPRQRLVFGRAINPAFAVAEVIWIMAGANDSSFLRFWNPRMMQFTDDDKQRFHGAYGYRLGIQPRLDDVVVGQLRHELVPGQQRLDQIKSAYEALQHTPHSRQVVLQIWNSAQDLPNPGPRSRDVPCNLMSHLLLRNGRLDWLQVMRSNDLMWGTPYNFVQFTTMQEIIAGWLGVEVGTYHHLSDSLHVYERHWRELDSISSEIVDVPVNWSDVRVDSYAEWERLWARLVDLTLRLSEYTQAPEILDVSANLEGIPAAYREWIALLTAEALRSRRHLTEAYETIPLAGPFWSASWRQWAEAAEKRRSEDAVPQIDHEGSLDSSSLPSLD
jgi:thymidylate synthase